MVSLFGKKDRGQQVRLVVRGMSCGHCEMRVKKALLEVEGVQDAEASHVREEAIVTVDPKLDIAVDTLVAAVKAAGYEAQATDN